MLILATVPRTGSNFVIRLLHDKDVYRFMHISDRNLPDIMQGMAEHPCIVPIRELWRIILSWLVREKDVNDLDRSLELLVSEVDKQAPYYLPVDRTDSREYLQVLNAGIDLGLETDFQQEPARIFTYDRTITAVPDDLLRRFYRKYGEFFTRFGYPIKEH